MLCRSKRHPFPCQWILVLILLRRLPSKHTNHLRVVEWFEFNDSQCDQLKEEHRDIVRGWVFQTKHSLALIAVGCQTRHKSRTILHINLYSQNSSKAVALQKCICTTEYYWKERFWMTSITNMTMSYTGWYHSRGLLHLSTVHDPLRARVYTSQLRKAI